MPGRQRPGKLNRRRVVHKSTGGMLNSIPAPVDPVGNAPSSSLNTVAHLDPLPEEGEGLPKARWPREGQRRRLLKLIFNSLLEKMRRGIPSSPKILGAVAKAR